MWYWSGLCFWALWNNVSASPCGIAVAYCEQITKKINTTLLPAYCEQILTVNSRATAYYCYYCYYYLLLLLLLITVITAYCELQSYLLWTIDMLSTCCRHDESVMMNLWWWICDDVVDMLSTTVCWKGTFCAFLCELFTGFWKWVPITPKMLIDFCFSEK
jgi:hypothetical protein